MCSFKSIYFVLLYLVLNNTNALISDKRLCVDPDCSEPASFARTLLTYSSPDRRVLSFKPNQNVIIYSKEAGSNTDLWGAEINGRRGYLNKHHVKENRILKVPTLLVNTELEAPVQTKEEIQPDGVKEAFEVIDGTTILLGTPEETTEPIKAADVAVDAKEEIKGNGVDATEAPAKEAEKVTETPPIEAKGEESVVDNVVNKFSSWLGDSQSDEEDETSIEEDDDAEDDEDDEEDEEEDDIEELGKNATESIETEPNLAIHFNETSLDEATISKVEEIPKVNEIEKPISEEIKEPIVNEIIEPIVNEIKEPVVSELKTNPEEINLPAPSSLLGSMFDEGIKMASFNGNLEEPLIKLDSAPEPNVVESVKEPEIIEHNKSTEDISAEVPITSQEVPIISQEVPITSQEVPITSQEIPATSPEVPVTSSEVPISLDEVPLTSTEVPAVSSEVPPIQELPTPEPVTEPSYLMDDTILNKDYEFVTPDPLNVEITAPSSSEEFISQENQSTDLPIVEPPSEPLPQEVPIANEPEIVNNNEIPLTEPETQTPSSIDTQEVPQTEVPTTVPETIPIASEASSQEFVPEEVKQPLYEPPSQPSYFSNLGQSGENVEVPTPPSSILNNLNDPNVPSFGGAMNSMFGSQYTESSTEAASQENDLPPVVEEVTQSTEIEDTQINDNIGVGEVVEQTYVSEPEQTNNEQSAEVDTNQEQSEGFFDQLLSYFSSPEAPVEPAVEEPPQHDYYGRSQAQENQAYEKQQCSSDNVESSIFNFNGDILIYLTTTAASVIIFLFGYMAMDKSRRESPLVARINRLEKDLLITMKENEQLQEQQGGIQIVEQAGPDQSELVEQLQLEINDLTVAKQALEAQVQDLEKELDTSTEVGMELNRIVSEMLNSSNGSETLKANVEQLQRQLVEQQDTINSINETLREKETENLELHLEMDISNKKVVGLQAELDGMVEKILKIEEERDLQQSSLESEIILYQTKHKEAIAQASTVSKELQGLKQQLADANRTAELKTKEYGLLRQSLDQVQSLKNNSDTMKSLLDVTAIRAELQQLKVDNQQLSDKLANEEVAKINLEKQIETTHLECDSLRHKYETADKEKLEINTKLDVLNNYFKEKEAQLQKEISKYESIWAAKEGEATSSTERIKHIQEELQNYKTQNETLKQEIVNQEVALKSQISVLEKKIHENWVTARQSDRKLEEAKQEAAQLRNRLTLRERALTEEKAQNRLQSPMDMNGEHPLSPPPLQSPASPPLLYGARDLTKSPPMPGLPFLPPPPGAPYMPPPMSGMPPFMPPPPHMFPDHRPPPLGRMSSPPPPRYTPESTVYSGYDRNSPSPSYDQDYRTFSPYQDDRRDYPRHKVNGRLGKAQGLSSGSDQSHDSIGKSNRKHGKV